MLQGKIKQAQRRDSNKEMRGVVQYFQWEGRKYFSSVMTFVQRALLKRWTVPLSGKSIPSRTEAKCKAFWHQCAWKVTRETERFSHGEMGSWEGQERAWLLSCGHSKMRQGCAGPWRVWGLVDKKRCQISLSLFQRWNNGLAVWEWNPKADKKGHVDKQLILNPIRQNRDQ